MSQNINQPSIHRYCNVGTDLGDFRIAWSSRGITAICPAAEPASVFEKAYEKRTGICPQNGSIPAHYRQAINKAFRGEPTAPELIDWSYFTKFQKKVLRKLMEIPAGTVQTYAWLARRSGHPKASRAVGNVMARNPVPFLLPCHRVVPASGGIGNYGLGKQLKRTLLEKEGVIFK
jgi:O-6-methylguanine DNA methyltransferase